MKYLNLCLIGLMMACGNANHLDQASSKATKPVNAASQLTSKRDKTAKGSNQAPINDYPKKYTPFSIAVIEVNYQTDSPDVVYVEARAQNNIPNKVNKSRELALSVAGTYFLQVEIDRPAAGKIYFNKQRQNIFLSPADTTKITLSHRGSTTIAFTGKYQEINNYYQKKQRYLGYHDIRRPLNNVVGPGSTFNTLKLQMDSVVGVEQAFFNSYERRHQLPASFIAYENAEITYSGAAFKTGMPRYNEIFKVFADELPNDFFDYVEKHQFHDQSAVLSTKYRDYLSAYFLLTLPKEHNDLDGYERIRAVRSHFLDQSKATLSGQIKEVYHQSIFCDMLYYHRDSDDIDSLARKFGIEDFKPLLKISGTKSKTGIKPLNLSPGDVIPDFYVANTLDSIVSIRTFKDKTLYLNFWATWCVPCIKNFPALNTMIDELSEEEDVVVLNICLDSDKEKWQNALVKHGLKGINFFAEGNWNKKLRANFNINGIPHYTIIGKGNILKENFANKAPHAKSSILEVQQTTSQ